MIEAIRNALAVKALKRAGIFVEMRVIDRGGEPQTRFIVKHHGVTSSVSRRAAVQLARTMAQFDREDEFRALVWSE